MSNQYTRIMHKEELLELGKKFNCHYSNVFRILLGYGIELRPGRRSVLTDDRLWLTTAEKKAITERWA